VRRRIWRVYRRRATVLHPPVAVETFRTERSDGYFLMVSEMVSYKRLDYAIREFARNGRRLKVVGDGPEFKNLRRLAGRNVEFCGRVPDEQLREVYARSAALIMPGEEDFGMTMVESLASGKPVIALGRGGAMEIVSDGCGILYNNPDEAHLADALKLFDANEFRFDSAWLRAQASAYSEQTFEAAFQNLVMRKPAARPTATPAAKPIPIGIRRSLTASRD